MRQTEVCRTVKGSNHAKSKKRKQTPGTAEENSEVSQGLSRYEVKALSISERVGGAWFELRLYRTQIEEARFPLVVDRAHRRRRATQWPQLFAVHARFETGGNRTRSQDSGRLCSQTTRGFHRAGRSGKNSSRE